MKRFVSLYLLIILLILLLCSCTQGDGNAPASGAESSKPVETSEPGENSAREESQGTVYSIEDYCFDKIIKDNNNNKNASKIQVADLKKHAESYINEFREYVKPDKNLYYGESKVCVFRNNDGVTKLPERLCTVKGTKIKQSYAEGWETFTEFRSKFGDSGWFGTKELLTSGEKESINNAGIQHDEIDGKTDQNGEWQGFNADRFVYVNKYGLSFDLGYDLYGFSDSIPKYSELCDMPAGTEESESNSLAASKRFLEEYFNCRLEDENALAAVLTEYKNSDGHMTVDYYNEYMLDPEGDQWVFKPKIASVDWVDRTAYVAGIYDMYKLGPEDEKVLLSSVYLPCFEVTGVEEPKPLIPLDNVWSDLLNDPATAEAEYRVYEEGAELNDTLWNKCGEVPSFSNEHCEIFVLDYALCYETGNDVFWPCYKILFVCWNAETADYDGGYSVYIATVDAT